MRRRLSGADRMKTSLCTLPLVILFGCTMNRPAEVKNTPTDLPEAVGRVSTARIFFGHQSVGANILTGIDDLLADSTLKRIRIVGADARLAGSPSYFAHAAIGKNGSPITKCDAFADAVRLLAADSLQLALMKFCYADFGPETNVEELFRYYTKTIDRLHSEFPRIRFVHVTAPLLRESPLWRRIAYGLLGREDQARLSNIRINRFNELLTASHGGDALFDLAARESTFGDGTRRLMAGSDSSRYTLIEEYTSDGGHLNEFGRKLVAKEFLETLARAMNDKERLADPESGRR